MSAPAAPTGLSATAFHRRMNINPWGKILDYDIAAKLTWTNNEATPHTIKIEPSFVVSPVPRFPPLPAITYVQSGVNTTIVPLINLNPSGDYTTNNQILSIRVVAEKDGLSSQSNTINFAMSSIDREGTLNIPSINGNTLEYPAWSGIISSDVFGNNLGEIPINFARLNIYDSLGREVFFSQLTLNNLLNGFPLPAILENGQLYTARTRYYTNWLRASQPTPATKETNFQFFAPAPIAPFLATDVTERIARNSAARIKLLANYRATWAINSGNPSGFSVSYSPPNFGTATGPDEAYLIGTSSSSGSFVINMTATKFGTETTATSKVNLTVVDSLPRTTIASNSSIVRDGLFTTTSDPVSILLESTPSPATWQAEGLPPGITISERGIISGRATKTGVYFSSITAQAEDYDVSAPTVIKFTITTGTGVVTDNLSAQERSPWLLNQWELTDLHVIARTRAVESTLFDEGFLRVKLGDALNFAVLFVDSANEVFALAPTQLRLTIRKADNLDDLIIFKSATPPTSATTEGQTYYLMPVTTGNREREVALEWAEENGKNEPLQCVADLDWTYDGKLYSSRTFPVLLELDVTRP
jgi:hypothetical protein